MSSGTELYLVRHGEAENTLRTNYVAGRSNHLPLTEKGIEQSLRLKSTLGKLGIHPSKVCSSPALRARETARYALDQAVFDRLLFDDRLQELDAGEWTGKAASDIFTDEVQAAISRERNGFRPPSGESFDDVSRRMLQWANSVAVDRQVLAFTHGGSIRCLAAEIEGWSHEQTYATNPQHTSISLFLYDGHGWSLSYLGKMPEEVL